MKFLHSAWGIAIIGLVMNALVVSFLMLHFYKNIENDLARSVIQPDANGATDEKKKPYWVMRSSEIEVLSYDLIEKRKALKNQSADIAQAMERMKVESEELKRLRSDIENYRHQLEATRTEIAAARQSLLDQIVEVRESELKNLKMLAAAYSNLTPQAVITIFKEMTDNLAVKILSQMKPELVASIFEEMSKSDASNAKDSKTMIKRVADLSDRLRLVNQSK